MATVAERFNALVDRTGPHDRWLGATDQGGIPQMRLDGRLTTARRVAWQLHHGRLPRGARVRACADDPSCVRVEHLTIAPSRARPRARERSRRNRGDGSMREIRAGVWKLTVTKKLGHRVSRTIHTDQTGAARELARLAAQHGHCPATLDALVTVYLTRLDTIGRSRSTLRRYEQLWRTWLAPSLAATHPDNLRRSDIERALTAMYNAGQSQRSIHQAAVVLNTTLAWAREQQITQANPATRCQLPGGTILTTTRHR